MRFVAAAVLLCTPTLAASLAAQARGRAPATPDPAAVSRAVQTITAADVRARISVLADDSMRGRGTPSPELEEVAAWIAAEFRRFGLRPGGDSGTFFQRYVMRRTQLDTTSFVMAEGRGAHGHWLLGRDAIVGGVENGTMPEGPVSGPLVLMIGAPADTARPFGDLNVRGSLVLHLPTGPVNFPALIGKARDAGVRAWILARNVPSPAFAAQARRALRPDMELVSTGAARAGLPVFVIRDSSAAQVLGAAGLELGALRAGGPSVRALEGVTAAMQVRYTVLGEASAPNVIGVLEGSDPQLRNEYVFYTAHMDHVGAAGMGNGCSARGADSICNGADDDASGTAGVVELAQAFATLQPRPRRSMVFMTVSGEERGLWGSQFYSDHPTLPLENTVADLNIDMVGRYFNNQPGWRDTISVIGKEHSTLGEVANRVAREHPELHMQLVDDMWPSENFYFRSDHYNFARKGVPILFFFNGTHPDYHQVSDTVDKIDAEKEARVLQMLFYIGLEVANADERPQWNPESRARIVERATP